MQTTPPFPLPHHPDRWGILAYDENPEDAKGFLEFILSPERGYRPCISMVYTSPEYRNQGVYTTLVRTLIGLYPNQVTVISGIPASAAAWYTLNGVEVLPGELMDENGLVGAEAAAARHARDQVGADNFRRAIEAYKNADHD